MRNEVVQYLFQILILISKCITTDKIHQTYHFGSKTKIKREFDKLYCTYKLLKNFKMVLGFGLLIKNRSNPQRAARVLDCILDAHFEGNLRAIIAAAYAPTEDAADDAKEYFYVALQDSLTTLYQLTTWDLCQGLQWPYRTG